jgi:hypothetical protein
MLRFSIALILLCVVASTPATAAAIMLPDQSWHLQMDVSAFNPGKDYLRPDGRSRQLLFRSRDSRVDLLVELKPAMAGLEARDYRDRRREKVETESTAQVAGKAKSRDDGEVAHLEYVLEGSFKGVPYRQHHFHVFLRAASTRIEVHVAFRNFDESDRAWVDDFRASIGIVTTDSPAPSR